MKTVVHKPKKDVVGRGVGKSVSVLQNGQVKTVFDGPQSCLWCPISESGCSDGG